MKMEKSVPKNLYSKESEDAILGSMFINSTIIPLVLEELEVKDFYDTRNKHVFKAFISVFNAGLDVDLTSVLNELESNNTLENAGGFDYISSLLTTVYTSNNVDTYIKIVKDCSIKRRTLTSLQALMRECIDTNISANDFLSKVENEVDNFTKNIKTDELERIDITTSVLKEKIQEKIKRIGEGGNAIPGISTGFKQLNDVTLGFQKEQLIILAARPAMGKSALAMNLAVNVAKCNKEGQAKVAVFSLEMSKEQLLERMVANEANIELGKIRKGNLSGFEINKLLSACEKLNSLNIYFDDTSSITIEDLCAKCRKQQATTGLDFVVIDYLQLIDGSKTTRQRQEEVAKISRKLKSLARQLQIPILALAQLSREVEKRENKKPIMADLRESGSIEQDADIVAFLYREDYYKKMSGKEEQSSDNGTSEAVLTIAKNRSGSAGVDIRFLFTGKYSNFREVEE